jgi:hypothetical protein
MKTWKLATILTLIVLLTASATIAASYAISGWAGQTLENNQPAASVIKDNTPQTLAPITQTDTEVPKLYTPSTQATSGYENGWGWGGCMGRWVWGAYQSTTTTNAVDIKQATVIAQTYVASLNNPDLKVTQVQEYQNNYYFVVSEQSTRNGAFELLINKATGIVTPEPGPNMMWNTEYTFGAGWCNWVRGTNTASPTITADQAVADAQQYLNTYLSGTTTGDITSFPGYYTVEVLSNGSHYSMLSVNAFTGQVWYHTWHGAFLQEQTIS